MCRIIGVIDKRKPAGLDDTDISLLSAMRDTLTHGGPDGSGLFIQGNVGLGHRRLAIIDLSEAGAQPMEFDNWVIVFNGEIYNYREIQAELIVAGVSFKTNSDTEVIIKAIDYWGWDAVKKFKGMFAFSLWDKREEKLFLCRDRLGVKPLQWYLKDNLFLFASEIKAFHAHNDFDKKINLDAIPHYLQKGYIHPTQSIFKYVRKVKPGTIVEVDKYLNIIERTYWDIETVYKNTNVDERPVEELCSDLESILSESFQYRMVSDVPVGIFLSGGIDSTLVATLLQKNNNTALKTFTIGFNDADYNEADSAQQISNILGTDHTSYICSEEDFKRVIPLISTIYDEPFGDSSAIPTILVSELARKDVKVVLSGDGGDELFGGYSKYHFSKYSPLILRIPIGIRKFLYKLSFALPPDKVEWVAKQAGFSAYGQIRNKYYKFQNTLLSESFDDFFEKSSSYLIKEQLLKIVDRKSPSLDELVISPSLNRLITYQGIKDVKSYLPGDILTKVDRASMSVGLEAREPFLDQKIIDFSCSIKDSLKFDEKERGKFLLKKILKKYIPASIVDRPKQGFTIPIEKWMKSILQSEMIELENDNAFFEVFQLNEVVCKSYLSSFHNNKNLVNPHELWFLYCLHQWYKTWIK